jgi:hypothetical protein
MKFHRRVKLTSKDEICWHMNCINGWNYIHGWKYSSQTEFTTCMQSMNQNWQHGWWNFPYEWNSIIWMKVTFPLTFINIHLTCVSHSSSLPHNMCNWPYGWKFDNKIWTPGWQWQFSTLLNFIYMVNNIHIVSLFHGHNFIHMVASLLMRFPLSYFYHVLHLIYVINFIHTCHIASLCFDFIHVMKFNHFFDCIRVVQFSSKWSISFMLSNSSLWSYIIHASIINMSFHINFIYVKI